MPVFFKYFREPNFLLTKQEGVVTYRRQLALYTAVRETIGPDLFANSLADWSGVTDVQLTAEEVFWQSSRFAREASRRGFSAIKRACYAPNDLAFGYFRMYQGFNPPDKTWDVKIVSSMQEGFDWLEITVDQLATGNDEPWIEVTG